MVGSGDHLRVVCLRVLYGRGNATLLSRPCWGVRRSFVDDVLDGQFTRVHQNSCAIGLVVGVVYGLTPLLAPHVFPEILGDGCAAYFFGVVVTAGTMVIVSVVMGWEARGQTSSPGAGRLAEVE